MHHFPTHPVSSTWLLQSPQGERESLGHGKASSPAIYLRLHFIPTFWPENVQKAGLKRAHMSVLHMSKEKLMSPTSPSGFSCFLCDGALASFIILMGLLVTLRFSVPFVSQRRLTQTLPAGLWSSCTLCYSCFSPAGLDTENSGPPKALIS